MKHFLTRIKRKFITKYCMISQALRIFANVNGKHCKGKAKMNVKQ